MEHVDCLAIDMSSKSRRHTFDVDARGFKITSRGLIWRVERGGREGKGVNVMKTRVRGITGRYIRRT